MSSETKPEDTFDYAARAAFQMGRFPDRQAEPENPRKVKRVDPPWTEGECLMALRAKYPAKEHALLPHVRDATGYDAKRTADALAMSLWPSRGLSMIGFEIKSSRSDWKRELEQPEKAETFAQYCNEWWLVTGNRAVVADVSEIPAPWGWMTREGDKLVVVRKARVNEHPADLGRKFLASILKGVAEWTPGEQLIEAVVDTARKAWTEKRRLEIEREEKEELRRQERSPDLQRVVARFEALTGIDIARHGDGLAEKSSAQFKAVVEFMNGIKWQRNDIAAFRARLVSMQSSVEELLAAFPGLDPEPRDAPEGT